MKPTYEELEEKLAKALARETSILDDWDDLLEDLELHGMHDFPPYIKSKAKFRAYQTKSNKVDNTEKTELMGAKAEITRLRENIKAAYIEVARAKAGFTGFALRVAPNDPGCDFILQRLDEAERLLTKG